MMASTVLLILLLLVVKHFIVDFPLQKPYQFLNKGTYGHLGGILHSGLHGIGTLVVLIMFAPIQTVLILSIIDFVLHYHIDWAKVNINKHFGWGPTTHEEFWVLLGIDQTAHLITYLGLVYALI